MSRLLEQLANRSCGLRIEASKWSTHTSLGSLPDLIQFAIVGKRGGLKGEATVTPEVARYYHDLLSDLLGVPRAQWPASTVDGGSDDA